jgi:hypothetical protein
LYHLEIADEGTPGRPAEVGREAALWSHGTAWPVPNNALALGDGLDLMTALPVGFLLNSGKPKQRASALLGVRVPAKLRPLRRFHF